MFCKRLLLVTLCSLFIVTSAQAAPLTSFDEWNGCIEFGAWNTETTLSDVNSEISLDGKYNFTGGITFGLGNKWGIQYRHSGLETDNKLIRSASRNEEFLSSALYGVIKGNTDEVNILYSLDKNFALFAGVNRVDVDFNQKTGTQHTLSGTHNIFQGGVVGKAPLGDNLDFYGLVGGGSRGLFQAEAGLAVALGDSWQADVGYRWFRVKDAFNKYDGAGIPDIGKIKTDGIKFGFTYYFDKKKQPVAEKPVEEKPIVEKPVVEPPVQKPEKIILKGVNFDFDKATLKSQAYPILDNVVALALKNPDWKLALTGHTDSFGSDAYNLKLSTERVTTVKNYLISKNIVVDRLTASGKGEREPIATNDTEEGRAENRRVEIVIQ